MVTEKPSHQIILEMDWKRDNAKEFSFDEREIILIQREKGKKNQIEYKEEEQIIKKELEKFLMRKKDYQKTQTSTASYIYAKT
jgi:hypothetical protein